MKLNKLFSEQTKQDVERSWSKVRTAPKTHEIAFTNQKRFTGTKDRVMINLDMNDPQNSGFITHTHPIEHGPGTLLGAMPSPQDLESCISFALRSGHDRILPKQKVFINDPSDIEGMIIWHGPHYITLVPAQQVDLALIYQYEKNLKNLDFESAISTLERMGFQVTYGSKNQSNSNLSSL